MNFLQVKIVLLKKHYFDKWFFQSFVKPLDSTNFVLNKRCEQMHIFVHSYEKRNKALHELSTRLQLECKLLSKMCHKLEEEAHDLLLQLITTKMQSAENAFVKMESVSYRL